MTSTILAVDVGKYNSVLCWYEPGPRSASFRTVKNSPEEPRREVVGQRLPRFLFRPKAWEP